MKCEEGCLLELLVCSMQDGIGEQGSVQIISSLRLTECYLKLVVKDEFGSMDFHVGEQLCNSPDSGRAWLLFFMT